MTVINTVITIVTAIVLGSINYHFDDGSHDGRDHSTAIVGSPRLLVDVDGGQEDVQRGSSGVRGADAVPKQSSKASSMMSRKINPTKNGSFQTSGTLI